MTLGRIALSIGIAVSIPSANPRGAATEPLCFPRDHGDHPGFDHERWVFSGHLVSGDGRWYAYQLSFARIEVESRTAEAGAWDLHALYPAAMAITDLTGATFVFRDRLARAGPGRAHAGEEGLDLRCQGWRASRTDSVWSLHASEPGIGLTLSVMATGQVVSDHGGSARTTETSDGRHGNRYAMPGLPTRGTLNVGQDTLVVSGLSWLDHAYGNDLLCDGESGWDRLSLLFRDGSALLVYRIRSDSGFQRKRSGGAYVSAGGIVLPLDDLTVRLYPKGARRWNIVGTGASYPLRWRIEVPGLGLWLDAEAQVPDQEFTTLGTHGTTFWRGSVGAQGARGRTEIIGAGFLEMTGYVGAPLPSLRQAESTPAIAAR